MKYLNKIVSKLGAITFFLLAGTKSAFATGATVTFNLPGPASIPTLSGTMLILLSVLLCMVAYRTAKQKNTNSNKLFITVLGAGFLVSASSGVKLVSDAHAGGPPLTPIVFATGSNTFSDTIPPPPMGSITAAVYGNTVGSDLNFTITAGDGSLCRFFMRPGLDALTIDDQIPQPLPITSTYETNHSGTLSANFNLEVNCGESSLTQAGN